MIPDEAVDAPGFRLADWFGREAPLVVEIGSGVGEATGVLAATRPAYDVLALEVWRPGVAASLAEVAAAGATNVRFCSVDAVWTLEHLVAPGALAELWTFFPDPWPKTRHHKRRIVDARVRRAGGDPAGAGARWRLATDWADYAEQMRSVLDAEPGLTGGVVRAVGRAAGDEVRAQGPRGRPGDHRPLLHAGLTHPEVDAGALELGLGAQPLALTLQPVGDPVELGRAPRGPGRRRAAPRRTPRRWRCAGPSACPTAAAAPGAGSGACPPRSARSASRPEGPGRRREPLASRSAPAQGDALDGVGEQPDSRPPASA